jgi:hypothetical protein
VRQGEEPHTSTSFRTSPQVYAWLRWSVSVCVRVRNPTRQPHFEPVHNACMAAVECQCVRQGEEPHTSTSFRTSPQVYAWLRWSVSVCVRVRNPTRQPHFEPVHNACMAAVECQCVRQGEEPHTSTSFRTSPQRMHGCGGMCCMRMSWRELTCHRENHEPTQARCACGCR